MHIRSIDLNLLVIAAALYRHRNVSRAAEELNLSQSAVSHALTRLRDQFNDALFVRTSKGMAPTEYARNMQSELMDIVHRAELLTAKKTKFDPLEAVGRITVASTDYVEVLVMPKLAALLAKEAPRLQLSLRPTYGSLPKRELEEGTYDMAIAGFYRDMPEGFYQSKLFTDYFECAVGKNHPLFKTKDLTREQFYSTRHALITLQGDFRENPSSETKAKRLRNFVYGSYSFTGMAWVLQDSDMLLTAPHLLLDAYKRNFQIKTWVSPIDRGPIDLRVIWHAQTHEDPLRQWMRAKIKEICGAL